MRITQKTLFICLFLAAGFSALAQRAELGVPLGHETAIMSAQLLSDGTLVTTDLRATIHRWDLKNKRLAKSVNAQLGLMLDEATDAGITYATPADPSKDFTFYINLNTGNRITCQAEEESYATEGKVAITVDGKFYLAEGGRQLLPTCSEFGAPVDLSFPATGITPRGDVIYQLKAGRLTLYDYEEGTVKLLSVINLEGAPEGGLLFYNTAEIIGQLREDYDAGVREYRFWDPDAGKLIGAVTLSTDDRVNDIHPSGKYLLVQSETAEVERMERRYNLATKSFDLSYASEWLTPKQISFQAYPGFIYSADGEYVIAPRYDGAIDLLNPETGTRAYTLGSHANLVNRVNISPDGERLYLGVAQVVGLRSISSTTVLEWAWSEENTLRKRSVEEEKLDELFAVLPEYKIPRRNPSGAFDNDPPSGSGRSSTPGWSLRAQTYWDELIWGATEFRAHGLHNGQVIFRVATKYAEPTGKLGDIRGRSITTFDTTRIAVGTNGGAILLFTGRGKFDFALQGHTEAVQDLTFSADGTRLVSAADDGTVKIWDLRQRKELATLVLLDEKEWVVLGPNNLFDASQGAMDLLYYKVEIPDEEIVEIIELAQMKEDYYDPGLLQKLLGFSSKPLRSVVGLEEVDLYPEVSGFDISNVHGENRAIWGQLNPRRGGIGKVSLFINGKEREEDINPNRETIFSVDLTPYNQYFFYENTISIRAYNEKGSLRGPSVEQSYIYPAGPKRKGDGNGTGEALFSREQMLNARLYVLCVGTSDYTEGSDGTSMDLTFPNKDAEAMSIALETVGCELFCMPGAEVKVTCLTTEDTIPSALKEKGINWAYATKQTIEESLREIESKARVQDVVIVYFSGHGKTYNSNGKDQFHYLTHEVSPGNVGNETATRNAVISSEELTTYLKDIRAYKQVLILDACNSGKVIDDLALGTKELNGSQVRALTRMSDRTGLYLITGSAADMVSFEAGKYGQGLLTYALLKGMNSDLVLKKDDRDTYFVGVTELFEYAKDEVVELSRRINGIQRPQLNYPVRAGSFPIGIYNENTKIILPGEKPSLVRSSFQNSSTFLDDQDLTGALEAAFREEMSRGKDSRLVYLDINKAANAYRVGGRYTLSADGRTITLEAVLSREGQPPIALLEQRPGVAPKPIAGTIEVVINKLERAIYAALETEE